MNIPSAKRQCVRKDQKQVSRTYTAHMKQDVGRGGKRVKISLGPESAVRSLRTLQGLLEIDGLPSTVWKFLHDVDLLQVKMTCKRGHLSVFSHALQTKYFRMSTIQHWEERKRASVRHLLVDTVSFTVAVPAHLSRLSFGGKFNGVLTEGALPACLKELRFGHGFNQPLNERVLPASLKLLKFGHCFNQPLNEKVLPPGLEHLQFGYYFNQPLNEKVLPASLKLLKFGPRYNQPLNEKVLPPALIRFGIILISSLFAPLR